MNHWKEGELVTNIHTKELGEIASLNPCNFGTLAVINLGKTTRLASTVDSLIAAGWRLRRKAG